MTHLRASPKQQAPLDVFLQLIKTWRSLVEIAHKVVDLIFLALFVNRIFFRISFSIE